MILQPIKRPTGTSFVVAGRTGVQPSGGCAVGFPIWLVSRLRAPGEVRFNEGRDRELRLRAGGTATTPGTPWAQWPSHIVLASAGCYGLQVDTHVNSHSVIFEVIE